MHSLKPLRLTQALLLSSFAVFALGFSHISLNQRSMNGMKGMSDHSGISGVKCQIVCTTTTKPDEPISILNHDENDNDPLPAIGFTLIISLSALELAFIVKRLHLLSSWRPPDRILLCGHYADGL